MTAAPTCSECGAVLIATSEKYLCCPNAHGKLVPNGHGNAARARAEEAAFLRRADEALKASKE